MREDAAGNRNDDYASQPVRLRHDPEAPALAFERAPSGDPTQVSVAVAEKDLGYRRRPDRAQPRGLEHLAGAADQARGDAAGRARRRRRAAAGPLATARAGHRSRRERRRRRGTPAAHAAAADPVRAARRRRQDQDRARRRRVARRAHRAAQGDGAAPAVPGALGRAGHESRDGSPTATASRCLASRSRCSGRARAAK